MNRLPRFARFPASVVRIFLLGFCLLTGIELLAQAPIITQQPQSTTVALGQTATFTVIATGQAPLSYLWRKNGVLLFTTNTASYTTPPTTAADEGAQFTVRISNKSGFVVSSPATLHIGGPTAPSITLQPQNKSVIEGQTATFSVTASGTAPLAYQWYRNSASIGGATSPSYTTPATTRAADNGALFTVTVSNSLGSVTSNAATLGVGYAPPVITTQPQNQTVTAGQTATFQVTATGSAPLTYQWRRGDTNISGATSATYTTPPTTTADSGTTLFVIVTNPVQYLFSNTVTLTVNAPLSPPSIGYYPNSADLNVGTPMTPMTPNNVGGAATSWSISPALSAGLSINTSSGVISGTPTAAKPITGYTVTATNASGNGTATVTISVSGMPQPPVISYSPSTVTFTVGTAITTMTPANTGGAATSWSITPALPAGLSLNTSNGQITGTPTATSAATSYTVTAANAAGNGTTAITIIVNAASTTPTINNFTPTSGTVGTSVIITGTNFTGATAVKFNAATATFTVNNATQITATVPSGATTGTISVATPAGTATSTNSFTMNTGGPTITISPLSGSISVAGALTFVATVSGTANTAVTWSATGGIFNSSSGSTVVWKAPPLAGNYVITATSQAWPTLKAQAVVQVLAPACAP